MEKIIVDTGDGQLEELVKVNKEEGTVETLFRGHLKNTYPIDEVKILK